MNEQELMNQLKQADQAAGMPNLAPLDIPTLRRQVQRRQSVRRVLSVAAGLALVVGWWHFRPPLHEPPGTPMQTAADQLAALDTGAQQLDRLFDLVEQEQKFHQKERQVEAQVAAITEPLREVLGQADLVAADMVADAQRLMQQHRRRDAMKRYQRVIDLFPQSLWAEVASQRLQTIESNQKSTQIKGELSCQNEALSC